MVGSFPAGDLKVQPGPSGKTGFFLPLCLKATIEKPTPVNLPRNPLQNICSLWKKEPPVMLVSVVPESRSRHNGA